MSSDPLHGSGPAADSHNVFDARRLRGKHVLITIGALIGLVILTAAAVIYSGLFNVAATQADAAPLNWLLVTTREASIKFRARNIPVPALAGAAQRDNGFRIYRQMCVMCHTPVGRTATPMARGLNPQAPGFGKNADDMRAAELYWVTRNGIRFTGMPAWNSSLNDQELWDVVAFLATLPKMSAEDYDALDRRVPP
jgi:mono/diheme cytochrome c family protein